MVGPSPWQSITARLLAPVLASGVMLAGLIGFIFIDQYRDFAIRSDEAGRRQVQAASASLKDKEQQLLNTARLVARMPDIADALDAHHQRALIDAVTPFVSFTDLDILTIYDENGVVAARGDSPAVFGRPDMLTSWLRGFNTATPTLTMANLENRVVLLGVAPVATLNRAIGGWAVAGFVIDKQFITDLTARAGADIVARYDGRDLASSVKLDPSRPAPRRLPVILDDALTDGRFTVDVLFDDSAERARFVERLNLLIIGMIVLAALVVAGSVLVILRTVKRPLEDITTAMMALAAGNREVTVPGRSRGDEIGAMARAAEVFKLAMAETIALTESNQRERDEKERALTEAAAQSVANRQIQNIITASPVALLLCRDDPPVIEVANQAAIELFGEENATLTNMPLATIVTDASDRERLQSAFADEGRINRLDARLQTSGGRTVWGSISARVIPKRHRSALLLGIEDITQRKETEAALRTAKEQAETALAELERTQRSLVQAEKMASLSLLVAGVAHEINTPLGICLTAASHVADKTDTIEQAFADGKMRRSDLETYFGGLRQTMPLMLANMHRAADLIQSFKRVAVDQTSAERRKFDLATYIDEVLMSVGPHIKRAHLSVGVDCPPDIEIDSYPGALAQILSNLAINSCTHAYEGRESGHLTITANVTGDTVTLTYGDDGCGIPPENLERVFEPFFTTRRGSGGTGLGLHVVFNLASQTLRGGITVASEVGKGTTFTLQFPAHPR